MEPVSTTDRLVLLLRRKLEERARARGVSRLKARSAHAVAARSAVRALAAAGSVDERQVRRAVVQNILADQIGPELMNDAHFQQIVSRVTDAIAEDHQASGLLSGLIDDLRKGA